MQIPEPMDELEYRQKIYQKFREHFDHLYNLHQFAEASISNFRGVADTPYKTALWLINARAFKSLDSIRRLCEVTLCEDAAVVLRSLLNLLAVTRWISIDPEKRAQKYLAWFWIVMHSDAERLKGRIPAEWTPTIQKYYELAKPKFEFKDSKDRNRMAEKWHEPEARTIRDLFEQVDLETHYVDGYKSLSSVEHCDASAFFAMVAPMEKGSAERRLEMHSDMFLPHYLRNTFQYFADIFRICNRTLVISNAEEFEKIVTAGINFYKADMEANGIPP